MTKSANELIEGDEVFYQQVWKTITKKTKGSYFPNSWEFVFHDSTSACWMADSMVLTKKREHILKAV